MNSYSLLVSVSFIIAYTQAQTCVDSGNGPSLPGLGCMAPDIEATAPDGSLVCCPPNKIATTTAAAVTTTAGTGSTVTAAGTTVSSAVGTTSSSSSSCADLTNPRTGVSDCSRLSYLCTSNVYRQVMQVQCRKTCGFCSSGSSGTTSSSSSSSCVDKLNPSTGVSDCPRVANLCTNPAYLQVMQQQCPKTCNLCGSGSSVGSSTSSSITSSASSSTCVDRTNPSTGVSDCARLSSLCNNSIYSTLMTQQCPLTCGRCGSSSGSSSGTSAGTTSASVTATTRSSGSTSSSGACIDIPAPGRTTSDCPTRVALCVNPIYLPLMRQQCPFTCGFCSG